MTNPSKRLVLKLALLMTLAPHSLYAETLGVAPTGLSLTEQAMLEWVDQHHDAILDELKVHVEMNTSTQNTEGLNAYRERLDQDLQQLGFSTQRHSSAPVPILTCNSGEFQIADHLSAERRGSSKIRLLLNGHMDTVFNRDDEFQNLEISNDGVLKGPGVADMKGGIVIMLNALRALHETGVLDTANLTVLFNSDEEIGSLGSRGLIEELAQQHDFGLVFEGSNKNLVTRARKGLGQARLKITGRESHAGAAHQEGVSASLELAHKIIAIEKLTNYATQSTVNVGVMSGGEKRNTIPGCADAYVDMRFPDQSAGEALKAQIELIARQTTIENELYPQLPSTEYWATLHRPAKAPHPAVDSLIAHAMSLSEIIGEPIVGTRYAGGGTDGSIAQGVGLPTFDSLGMDGSGAHSSREESTTASLIARTKLAAVLISRLTDGSISIER